MEYEKITWHGRIVDSAAVRSGSGRFYRIPGRRSGGGTGAFGWLDYGQTFGLSSPLVLDLGVVALTFGLTIRISVAGILGVGAALLAYRLL